LGSYCAWGHYPSRIFSRTRGRSDCTMKWYDEFFDFVDYWVGIIKLFCGSYCTLRITFDNNTNCFVCITGVCDVFDWLFDGNQFWLKDRTERPESVVTRTELSLTPEYTESWSTQESSFEPLVKKFIPLLLLLLSLFVIFNENNVWSHRWMWSLMRSYFSFEGFTEESLDFNAIAVFYFTYIYIFSYFQFNRRNACDSDPRLVRNGSVRLY